MSGTVLPDPIDLETMVRAAAFELLFRSANGVPPAVIADATGIKADRLAGLLGHLVQAGRIRFDDDGMVVGSAGLSVVPDRHQIEVEGRTFWTWCAYDFLGIFGALAASGRAFSPSPPDRKLIELAFVRGRPHGSNAVLFRPDSELLSRCENVYEEWCPNSNLFANRELAEAWAAEHGVDGQILSIEEASDLATEGWKPLTRGLSRT